MQAIACDITHFTDIADAVDRARKINTSFVEVLTYRFVEHCGPNNDDNLGYRPEHGSQEDRLAETEKELRRNPATSLAIDTLRTKYQIEISEAFYKAKMAPFPTELMKPLAEGGAQ